MRIIKSAGLILIVLFVLSVVTASVNAKDLTITPIVDQAALSEGSDKVPMIIGFNGEVGASQIQKLRAQGADIKRILVEISAVSVRIPNGAITTLEKDPEVKYVSVNGRISLIEDPKVVKSDIDPLVQTLPWGIDKIDAELVHPVYRGAGVLVSITDTGVNDSHEDLLGRVVGQWNYVTNGPDAEDDFGHGTHVAGTIAANDNTIGVIGVAPSASLLSMKFLDSTGSGAFDDGAASIIDSVNNGADIISMSWGASVDDPTVRAAIEYANSSGVLLIAAAGNSGGTPVGYPARYPQVIAVGATDSSDVIAPFSSYGPEVWVSAPGVYVLSTVPKSACYLCDPSGYAYLDGTSMATPHVSGEAALIMSKYPGITSAEVKRRLGYYSKDLGTTGKDVYYGWGRINASNATFSPAPPGSWPPAPPPPPPPYYTVTQPAYSWIDGVTGGTAGPVGDDSASASIPIGFNFRFHGTVYSNLWFSTNGLITFGGPSTDFSNDPIPSPNLPDNFAAPYWEDLNVDGTTAHTYYKLDTSTPKKFIITWQGVQLFGGTGRTTFEAVLYEDGKILYQYQQPSLFGAFYESIGVEDAGAARGQQYKYNEPVTDYSAVLFTPPTIVSPVAVKWSSVATTGAVDESDTGIFVFDTHQAYLNPSAPLPANLDIRYNVFIPGTFDGNNPGLKIRYRDNGASSAVRLYLREYNITSGAFVTRMTFDSNSYSTSSNYQTRTKSYCNPGWSFDFNNKIYFIEASLNKTASAGNPGLIGIQLTSSTC